MIPIMDPEINQVYVAFWIMASIFIWAVIDSLNK